MDAGSLYEGEAAAYGDKTTDDGDSDESPAKPRWFARDGGRLGEVLARFGIDLGDVEGRVLAASGGVGGSWKQAGMEPGQSQNAQGVGHGVGDRVLVFPEDGPAGGTDVGPSHVGSMARGLPLEVAIEQLPTVATAMGDVSSEEGAR